MESKIKDWYLDLIKQYPAYSNVQICWKMTNDSEDKFGFKLNYIDIVKAIKDLPEFMDKTEGEPNRPGEDTWDLER